MHKCQMRSAADKLLWIVNPTIFYLNYLTTVTYFHKFKKPGYFVFKKAYKMGNTI